MLSIMRSRWAPASGSMRSISASLGVPPEPMPNMNRPLAMWSSMAMRCATCTGSWKCSSTTPVPNAICSVSPSARAMNSSGVGMFSHGSIMCSPIQISEKPSRSALRTSSRSSS